MRDYTLVVRVERHLARRRRGLVRRDRELLQVNAHRRLSAPDVGSGRRRGVSAVVVTGRGLGELQDVFPELDTFSYVVAENGALLYDPATRAEKPLGDPPDERLVETLRAHGATPLSVGRVLVATREPYEQVTLE